LSYVLQLFKIFCSKCHFSTDPTIDNYGLRVQAQTASNYRKNGVKHTNMIQNDAFVPYGTTSSHYKNYIMGFPRL